MRLTATKKIGHVGRQLTMRDYLSLDTADQLKVAMSEALKNAASSGKSRAEVVDEMNRLASISGIRHEGKNSAITEEILNKWVARGSTGHNLPVRYLAIFCQATRSLLPIEAILPPGAGIIDEADVALLKWARVETERKKLNKESKRLAQEAGIE